MASLPMFLRKVSENIFGPADCLVQLVVDSVRDLLLSLSSASTVTVFRLPRPKLGADGRFEELAPVQLCTVEQTKLSREVSKVRAMLFPGLAPSMGRASQAYGSPYGQPYGASVAAVPSKLKIVRLLPLGWAQGGNIVACAVTDDGTRIFLRGVFRAERPLLGFSQESSMQPARGLQTGMDGSRVTQTMTQVFVHHVRFLDINSPIVCVKDAVHSSGSTLMLCKVVSDSATSLFPFARAYGGERQYGTSGSSDSDVLVAISTDLRAVAQRQSRGRSPWLSSTAGIAEHIEIVRLAGGSDICRAVALATFDGELAEPVERMYGSSSAGGMVLPVLGLSELAQQQLLPAQRFVLISNLGVHALTKVRPIDTFCQDLLKGDVGLLRDFSLQYTAEQTCALCFQLLTCMVPKPGDAAGMLNSDVVGLSAVAASERRQQHQQRGQTFRVQNSNEEMMLLRAEHLLLSPQLAAQLGFVQTWPSMDSAMPQSLSTSLGHSVHPRGTNQISARIRGLCLYMSRILRPLWLAPVMHVCWPTRPSDSGRKRPRGGDWWPPPPEPAPVVHGSRWQCAWSKQQRTFVHGQLVKLGAILERCKDYLVQEDSRVPEQRTGAAVVAGLAALIGTAVEALAFLELIAPRAEYLGTSACPPDALVRFSELTFRDLVCQSEARGVLQQLMRGGVVACRQLHARCPRLFSAVDLEVQEAYELLEVVRTNLLEARSSIGTTDMARWSHLVQRPLRTLERHAARVDLSEAAGRLRAVGACKGLVALCARIARARDPHDESLRPQDPSSARAQQLHYARLECYQVVLEVLEDLFVLARQCRGDTGLASPAGGGGGAGLGFAAGGALLAQDAAAGGARSTVLPELLPTPMRATDAATFLDAMLRHCLEDHAHGADELFHFCVLKWMMQRELPAYRYDSPYLRGFLETHARDQPELLCRYFQHRERWAEACDAYMALVRRGGAAAGGPELSRTEKLVLLQCAALCARMPGSCRRAEPILQAISELTHDEGNPQDAQYPEPSAPPLAALQMR